MESRYADFMSTHPSYRSRVEAFLGILSPDPKGVALWAMKPGVPYRQKELYRAMEDFSGADIPVTPQAVWAFYKGEGRAGTGVGAGDGYFCRAGFARRDDIKYGRTFEGHEWIHRYVKTDCGFEFGDPVVARAVQVTGQLAGRDFKLQKKSVFSILKSNTRNEGHASSRKYMAFEAIGVLANNKERDFSLTQLKEEIDRSAGSRGEGEASLKLLSSVLTTLGSCGVISYRSPHGLSRGTWSTGWARYRLRGKCGKDGGTDGIPDELSNEEARMRLWKEIRRGDYDRRVFMLVAEYMAKNLGADYSRDDLSEILGIERGRISKALSIMASAGYIESDFKGGKRLTIAKANDATLVLWNDLFLPVGIVAERLDPRDFPGFYDPCNMYVRDRRLRHMELGRYLNWYDMERTSRYTNGSRQIIRSLLELPCDSDLSMADLTDHARRATGTQVSCSNISRIINQLMIPRGRFKKTEKGKYRKIR